MPLPCLPYIPDFALLVLQVYCRSQSTAQIGPIYHINWQADRAHSHCWDSARSLAHILPMPSRRAVPSAPKWHNRLLRYSLPCLLDSIRLASVRSNPHRRGRLYMPMPIRSFRVRPILLYCLGRWCVHSAECRNCGPNPLLRCIALPQGRDIRPSDGRYHSLSLALRGKMRQTTVAPRHQYPQKAETLCSEQPTMPQPCFCQ